MTNSNYFFLVCLISCFFAACKTTDNTTTDSSTNTTVKKGDSETPASKPNLAGTWVVMNFPYNEKPFQPTKFYKVTFEKNQMGLQLDINSCGTGYKANAKQITFSDEGMSCTEACCDTKEAKALANLFKGSLDYSISNSTLTITTASGAIKLSNAQASIQGTSWVAVSYADRKEGKPIKFSKAYTLSFEPKSLQLRLDVNHCNTTCNYIDRASSIELPAQNMGCTRKCCDSDDGILLMESLQGKITYKREKGQLILKTFNKEIVLTPTEGVENQD